MFEVWWEESLWGFIHFIKCGYKVVVPTWNDACRVASVLEDYGREPEIIRI